LYPELLDFLDRGISATRAEAMARRSFACFHMVGVVPTLMVLGRFRSLGVSLIVSTMRLVISITVTVLSILAWGIGIVQAIILMVPLTRPMTISVSVLVVTLVGIPVTVTAPGVLGLGVFLGLLFAIHESGILPTAHISVMAAFEELLKFEHVSLD
jgi:hypothetical protein